ncbi:hypothetical protein JHD46_01980 [Sulfurimonas sp. SAG-AH-194-C20]|nr:hypothetical protein [Sulfurimonas sp. SAG-AH-194-C20]MDF1878404.1 hypothetical protein [Sulfurimonas sp. SAG-AH-194-C20]
MNEVVMSHFSCMDLSQCNDYDSLDEKFKTELELRADECLDMLAVYCHPTSVDNANILMSIENIAKVAKRYNVDYETFFDFVKIHEYAHAYMCEILAGNLKKVSESCKTAKYIILEESFATAIALKYLKKSNDYKKLEKFVENQAPQYRYGLEILESYEDNLEEIAKLWVNKKKEDIEVYFDFFMNKEKYNYDELVKLNKEYREMRKKIGKYTDLL